MDSRRQGTKGRVKPGGAEAQGEAGAIRLRARALTNNPQLVQYEYVKGLPDGVKTVIADTKTIISFSDLFGQTPAQQGGAK